MVRAMLALVLSQAKPCPEDGKWTKRGPAFDWLGKAVIVFDVIKPMAARAYGHLRLSHIPDTVGDGVTQELDWAAVKGARATRALELSESETSKGDALIRMVIFYTIRYLTRYW